jgi:hypothetical protein
MDLNCRDAFPAANSLPLDMVGNFLRGRAITPSRRDRSSISRSSPAVLGKIAQHKAEVEPGRPHHPISHRLQLNLRSRLPRACQSGSAHLASISSTTVAMPWNNSSNSCGPSCPFDCEIGRMGLERRALVLSRGHEYGSKNASCRGARHSALLRLQSAKADSGLMCSAYVVDLRRYRQRAGPDYCCEKWRALWHRVCYEWPVRGRLCLRSGTHHGARTWVCVCPHVQRGGTDILLPQPGLYRTRSVRSWVQPRLHADGRGSCRPTALRWIDTRHRENGV